MWDIYDRVRGAWKTLAFEERAIPLMRRPGAFNEALRIARSTDGWDIVHAQYGALVGALSTLSSARVHIVSLRGSDIYWRFGTARNRISGLARTFLSWIACLRSDSVVVMSHHMARRVRRWPGLARRQILIIPDPAGEIFWPAPVSQIFADLLTHPFSVIIASLQRDNPIKRTEIVIQAGELCRAAGMSLDILVLSGIPRTAVRAALDNADSIALSSTHEGWPNIVKEGLLLGKNFVATDVGDLAQYAPTGSSNHIVGPSAVEFACAWIDQIAARLLGQHGVLPELAPFHPDVVALKHRILYLACGIARS
jgi:glycosyltransferase involved in cell wall biosynthesis